ncbi:MAG: M48 family metallopeptidase [Hyphomicrobiales bacterium]|nr:M48 family metallopeptidase [Hyphomicrobiales bacterium]
MLADSWSQPAAPASVCSGGQGLLQNMASARAWLTGAALCCAGLALGSCGGRQQVPQVSQEAIQQETARQRAFRFESLISETRRLQSVSFRIRTANTAWCRQAIGPQFGMSVLSLENLEPDIRPIAAERLGLDQMVGVVHVVKNSPARRAGLAPGDRLVEVDGRAIPGGQKGTRVLAQILGAARTDRSLRVSVLRRGRTLNFTLTPVPGCAYPVLLAGQGQAPAFTNARRIIVQRDFIRLGSSDDELALIVAHELAHLVIGHLKKRRGDDVGTIIGGFRVDTPVGAEKRDGDGLLSRVRRDDSPETFKDRQEREADYFSLYFMARAGYDPLAAERFWRKMADENPETVAFAGAHPASPERFVLIGKTNDEIALKRRSKAPLEPNVRSR